MYRIHKNFEAGNAIIDNVLNEAWSIPENRYEGDIYYGLLDENSKGALVNLMLIEQNSICCYCMKEITAIDTTIEHIIPQSSTEIVLQTYLTVPELSESIIHKRLFDRNTRTIPPLLYPHDLGYNNFIASCNSTVNCNHKRGNKFISLFMYDEVMIEAINYESFGSCIPLSEDIKIDALNLNSSFLIMVRQMWYLISQKVDNLATITNPNELQLVVDEIIPGLDNKYLETFSGENSRVSELFKYKWFYNYYN